MDIMEKVFQSKIESFNDEERTIVHWITTDAIDRVNEIVNPNGMFEKKKPTVTWAHSDEIPAIAKSVWRTRAKQSGKNGWLAKTKFPPSLVGGEWYMMCRDDYLDSWSIRFKPNKDKIDENPKEEGVDRIYNKWELLGYALCNVGCNQEAINAAMEEGKIKIESEVILKSLGLQKNEKEVFDCECIECGYKIQTDEHCKDLKCPECGKQMRWEERPGPGQPSDGDETESAEVQHIIETGIEVKADEVLKPYPGEHTCVISTKKYDEYRRKNCDQKHDNKCIDVMWGIVLKPKRTAEIASLRYKIDVWTEASAKSHCKSREGKFEPAKKPKSIEDLHIEIKELRAKIDEIKIMPKADKLEVIKQENKEPTKRFVPILKPQPKQPGISAGDIESLSKGLILATGLMTGREIRLTQGKWLPEDEEKYQQSLKEIFKKKVAAKEERKWVNNKHH